MKRTGMDSDYQSGTRDAAWRHAAIATHQIRAA